MPHKNCPHIRALKNIDYMEEYKSIDQSLKMDACLECGTVFYGRRNKRFCCEECKNKFHNRKNRTSRSIRMRVTSILEKNYSILTSLLSGHIYAATNSELSLLGYSPGFLTSCIRADRHEQCSCYDICYNRTSSRIYNIRRLPLAELDASDT